MLSEEFSANDRKMMDPEFMKQQTPGVRRPAHTAIEEARGNRAYRIDRVCGEAGM